MDILLSPLIPIILFFLILLSISIYISFYLFIMLGILMIILGIGYKTENFEVDIKTSCYKDPCCDIDYEEDYINDDNEFCNNGIIFRRW